MRAIHYINLTAWSFIGTGIANTFLFHNSPGWFIGPVLILVGAITAAIVIAIQGKEEGE